MRDATFRATLGELLSISGPSSHSRHYFFLKRATAKPQVRTNFAVSTHGVGQFHPFPASLYALNTLDKLELLDPVDADECRQSSEAELVVRQAALDGFLDRIRWTDWRIGRSSGWIQAFQPLRIDRGSSGLARFCKAFVLLRRSIRSIQLACGAFVCSPLYNWFGCHIFCWKYHVISASRDTLVVSITCLEKGNRGHISLSRREVGLVLLTAIVRRSSQTWSVSWR